jgi:hypothetical protein
MINYVNINNAQEIKKVREWIDSNAETDGERHDSRCSTNGRDAE